MKCSNASVPGFPFLRCSRHEYFSEIMIIVETKEDLDTIQDFCRALYDNALQDCKSVYNKEIFPKLRFACKETLAYAGRDDAYSQQIGKLQVIDKINLPNYYPDKEYDNAIVIFEEAKSLYSQVIDSMSPMCFEQSLFPHTAYIYTNQFTGYTQSLRDNAGFYPSTYGCYVFEISSIHHVKNQNILQIAAGAVAKYLSEKLNQKFEYVVQ